MKVFNRLLISFATIVTVLAGFVPGAVGQNCIDYSGHARWISSLDFPPGWVQTVAIDGDWAYVSLSSSLGLWVVDISEPARPVAVASLNLEPSWTLQSDVANGILYMARTWAGVLLVDVTDPTHPKELSTLDVGYVREVEATSGLLYVALDAAILVYDVSDPQNPVWLSEVSIEGLIRDIVVVGELLFVTANEGGLYLFELLEGTAPLLVDRSTLPWLARSLAVQGDWVYVADDTPRLHMYRVDGGGTLEPTGTIELTNGANSAAIEGELLCLSVYPGIHLYDITSPSTPVSIGVVPTPGRGHQIRLSNGLAYVADGSYFDFQIYDFTDPVAPGPVGTLELPGVTKSVERIALGTQAVMTDDQLYIVSTENPAFPEILSEITTGGGFSTVGAGDGLLCVAEFSDDYMVHSLLVVDVSDPASPAVLGTQELAGGHFARDIWVGGGIALVAWSLNSPGFSAGVDVFDIETSGTPQLIGAFEYTTGSVRDIDVAGSYAFVSGYGGVTVLDISDPTQPAYISSIPTPTYGSYDVAVRD